MYVPTCTNSKCVKWWYTLPTWIVWEFSGSPRGTLKSKGCFPNDETGGNPIGEKAIRTGSISPPDPSCQGPTGSNGPNPASLQAREKSPSCHRKGPVPTTPVFDSNQSQGDGDSVFVWAAGRRGISLRQAPKNAGPSARQAMREDWKFQVRVWPSLRLIQSGGKVKGTCSSTTELAICTHASVITCNWDSSAELPFGWFVVDGELKGNPPFLGGPLQQFLKRIPRNSLYPFGFAWLRPQKGARHMESCQVEH